MSRHRLRPKFSIGAGPVRVSVPLYPGGRPYVSFWRSLRRRRRPR